jgi:hypothetical protein
VPTGEEEGRVSLPVHFANSDELCEYVAELSNGVCLLSFSCGKDSVVSWLKLRRYFKKVVPFFHYWVPHLSFCDNAIEYYQQYFGQKIYQFPHPMIAYSLGNYIDATPETAYVIEGMLEEGNIKEYGYEDEEEIIRSCVVDGISLKDAYVAVGTRMADSVNRRTAILRYGSVSHKRKKFQPIFDLKKVDMIRELDAANICLPLDYKLFGRTFDGMDARFVRPLVEHGMTEDINKIRSLFPLCLSDVARHEFRERYWNNGTKKKTEG